MISRPNVRIMIEERYGSVYRFTKAHPELSRSTVSMVIKGTYKGNIKRQLDRIVDVLNNKAMDDKVFSAIKGAACSKCTSKIDCAWCDEVFSAQARAVMKAIENKFSQVN